MKKAILYIHGKGGSFREAKAYQQNCTGYDVIGVDYQEYLPWIVQGQIQFAYDTLKQDYTHISIIANSIGAYFAMHTLQTQSIDQALLISPIVDMEKLILDMMRWANVSEKELCEKGEIPTNFGETLSWEYLMFVRSHPIHWDVPTEVLYAEKDNLTSRETIDSFVKTHNAGLTVMENGGHWFHTSEQIAFLDNWMKRVIC